jgi:type VI secretion system secreted protein VgrG
MSPELRADEERFLFKIGDKKLGVVDFTAREEISTPFEVDLTLATEEDIDFDDVIGKEALLTILGEEIDRYFHGLVNQFTQTGSSGRFLLYQATVVPSIWLLSLEQDCRIFQEKKVDEIVEQIIKDAGIPSDRFEFRLQEEYQPKEYCVQYRETDLNFISRLLEEEGIFYFFEHSEDKHLLVFGDSTVNYQPIDGVRNDENQVEVPFHPPDALVPDEEFVSSCVLSRQIRSGKATLKDFNFQQPSLDLTSPEQADSFQKLEVYDYPGEYLNQDRGKTLAKIRLEEAMMLKDKAEGESNCLRFIPGFTFKLIDHEREGFNQEYLLVEVLHSGSQPQTLEERAGGGGSNYFNQFLVIPSSVPLRPGRSTPKPVVEGVQTAIVAGPDGEEIYTDEYGRIKVQFHWDREGERNENSSCWIRVATSLAGGNYGCIFTPRIGQEVIVDFVEGDPDRPIVTGSVYNALTMPPYTLPDEKTKSTIKTNSSTGGDGFNEIRLEDKKGEEEIFIHGEKNLDMRLKNDRREWIGNDRHLVVTRDKLEEVGRDTHIVIKRDELKEIKRDHNLKIKGKESIDVTGSRSTTVQGDVIEVFKGKHSEQVTQDYYLKGMNVVVEAMTGLTIKVGGNFITLNSGGVFIKGNMVMLNSGGSALSGSAGNAVAAAAPLAAAIAGEAAPGRDPVYDAPTHQEPDEEDEEEKEEKEEKSWIEIELVDEDDNPVTGERYQITLPDGTTVATGTTDSNGLARVSGIDPGTCKITFPNLDKDAWEKA